MERSNSTELAEVSCQVSLGDFGIVFNLRLDISHVAAIITSYGSAPADSALLPFKTDRIGMPPNGRAQSKALKRESWFLRNLEKKAKFQNSCGICITPMHPLTRLVRSEVLEETNQ